MILLGFSLSGVIVTGNENPLVVGVPHNLTCAAVGINVARIEWRFLIAGFDLILSAANNVNQHSIQLTPSHVGVQMYRCVVKSTTGVRHMEEVPVTVQGVQA